MFSFVAGEAESVPEEDWQQLLAQLDREDRPRGEVHPLRHDG